MRSRRAETSAVLAVVFIMAILIVGLFVSSLSTVLTVHPALQGPADAKLSVVETGDHLWLANDGNQFVSLVALAMLDQFGANGNKMLSVSLSLYPSSTVELPDSLYLPGCATTKLCYDLGYTLLAVGSRGLSYSFVREGLQTVNLDISINATAYPGWLPISLREILSSGQVSKLYGSTPIVSVESVLSQSYHGSNFSIPVISGQNYTLSIPTYYMGSNGSKLLLGSQINFSKSLSTGSNRWKPDQDGLGTTLTFKANSTGNRVALTYKETYCAFITESNTNNSAALKYATILTKPNCSYRPNSQQQMTISLPSPGYKTITYTYTYTVTALVCVGTPPVCSNKVFGPYQQVTVQTVLAYWTTSWSSQSFPSVAGCPVVQSFGGTSYGSYQPYAQVTIPSPCQVMVSVTRTYDPLPPPPLPPSGPGITVTGSSRTVADNSLPSPQQVSDLLALAIDANGRPLSVPGQYCKACGWLNFGVVASQQVFPSNPIALSFSYPSGNSAIGSATDYTTSFAPSSITSFFLPSGDCCNYMNQVFTYLSPVTLSATYRYTSTSAIRVVASGTVEDTFNLIVNGTVSIKPASWATSLVTGCIPSANTEPSQQTLWVNATKQSFSIFDQYCPIFSQPSVGFTITFSPSDQTKYLQEQQQPLFYQPSGG